MYARSTTVQGIPDRIDQGIAMVRDEILPTVNEMPGCLGMSMIVDRASGHGIVTTSWESAEAMRATAEAVRPMRDRATELLGGSAEVHEWEVAVMHRAHHAPPGSRVRSTWLRMDPAQTDRGIDVFKFMAMPKLEELGGFCSASLLIDRAEGLGVSTVAYDDQTALEASRAGAEMIRMAATKEIGAEVLDVREHELVLAHLHIPEMA